MVYHIFIIVNNVIPWFFINKATLIINFANGEAWFIMAIYVLLSYFHWWIIAFFIVSRSNSSNSIASLLAAAKVDIPSLKVSPEPQLKNDLVPKPNIRPSLMSSPASGKCSPNQMKCEWEDFLLIEN